MIYASCFKSSPELSLPDSFQLLYEQYRRHALEVRQTTSETACHQLAYLKRFFLHIGPHRNRLSEYILHTRPTSPLPEVFLTLTEPFRPLQAQCLSWIIRRRITELGLELPAGVSRGTHGFRHAFAARMTGLVPFKDISDLMGHRDPDSTLIYGKIDTDALRQAALPWPGGEL